MVPGSYSSTTALLDSERDVLLEAPGKEPRVRASIVGDKKLTARDAFDQRVAAEQKKTQQVASKREVSNAETSVRQDAVGQKAEVAPRPQAERPGQLLLDDPLQRSVEKQLRRERGYHKATPHRGTRKKETGSKVYRGGVYRTIGLMLLLPLFIGIVYFAGGPVMKLLERPLKSVAVEGHFQYLSKGRAMELIMAEIDGNFLQLKLDRLKSVLQSDPWVENVFLSRRWPDTLVVKISEQQPIARWDANGFLNQRGEIIRVKEIDKLLGLPWLQGNEFNAREIMQQYQDLSTLLRTRGLEIITLKCDNKKSWRITLKNDVEIAIGRDQVMEKLRRFVTVYDNFLSSVWGDVKSIDIRYTNGVAVRWMPDSEMAKKYLKLDTASVHGQLKPNTAKHNTETN